jgi:RNA polymerase sigma-70 factor (ECF subfamily)
MEPSDRETYRAAVHGDHEAFAMIIRSQSRPLFAIAYGILQNREEAEDAVQDAFVKAWKSRWRIRDPEKFPGWLATIARHRARDVFRRRSIIPADHELHPAASSDLPIAEMDPDEDDRHSQVRSALADLPELHRSALVLRYFEEMDYRSIEDTLGLTNGALRGILGRAMASLRKRLRPALASLD